MISQREDGGRWHAYCLRLFVITSDLFYFPFGLGFLDESSSFPSGPFACPFTPFALASASFSPLALSSVFSLLALLLLLRLVVLLLLVLPGSESYSRSGRGTR